MDPEDPSKSYLKESQSGNSMGKKQSELVECEQSNEATADVNKRQFSIRPHELTTSLKGKLCNIRDSKDLYKDEVEDSTKTLRQIKAESLVQDVVKSLSGTSNLRLHNVISKRVSFENEIKECRLKRKQKHPQKNTGNPVQQSNQVSPHINPHNFAETLQKKLHNALTKEESQLPPNNNFVKALKRKFETIVDNDKPVENLYDRAKLAKCFRESDKDIPTTSEGDQQHKKFQCKYCFESFAHMWNLVSHVDTHSGDQPYQCKICAEKFSNVLHLKLHLKEHSDEKPFSCEYCAETFAYWTDMTNHKKAAHKGGDKAFQCDVCGKYFRHFFKLKKHFKVHLNCEMCGKSCMEQTYYPQNFVFLSKLLARQIDSRKGEQHLKCDVCGKHFKHLCRLKKHFRVHAKLFSCGTCGKFCMEQLELAGCIK